MPDVTTDESSDPFRAIKAELDEIYQANERMAAERDEVYAANERMAAQFDALQQQFSDLQDESLRSGEASSSLVSKLQRSEAALQSANATQRLCLAATDAERKEFALQLEQSIARAETLREQYEVACQQIRDLESDKQSLTETVNATAAELMALRESHNETDARASAQAAKLARIENELQQIQETDQQKIQQLSLAKSQAQTQLAVAERESDRLRLQISQLESEFATLQHSYNDKLTALGDSESNWKMKACQLETQLAVAATEIAQTKDASQQRVSALLSEQSQTKAQLSISEQTVHRLQDRVRELELESASAAGVTVRLSETTASLQQSQAEKARLAGQLLATQCELELLREQVIEEEQSEPDWLPSQEETEQPSEAAQEEQRIDELINELESHHRQFRELNESYSLVQHWLEQERETSQELKTSIQSLRLKMLDSEEELDSLRRKRSRSAGSRNSTTATRTKKTSKRVTKRANTPTKRTAKDDLCKVEGIGPKISVILARAKITTFRKLSATNQKRLQTILEEAGSAYKGRDVSTWAKQAQLAADERWSELDQLQRRLRN